MSGDGFRILAAHSKNPESGPPVPEDRGVCLPMVVERRQIDFVFVKRISLDTGSRHIISGGLFRLLADSLVLLHKVRHLSWRATGSGDLRSVVLRHRLALDAAVDRLASRITALGCDVPPDYADLTQGASIEPALEPRSKRAMIAQIAADHDQILADLETLEAMLPLDRDKESADLLRYLADCHRKGRDSLHGYLRQADGNEVP